MNAVTQLKARTKKVFYGWWVVGAGTFLYFLGIGSIFYGFSTFFNPMVAEFGWSRTVTSGAYSLSRLEGGIEGPIIGPLIDKFGARKLIFIGVALAGIGFIAVSRINNALGLYLIFGLLISMGYNTGFFHATTTAAANWFIKKRSRALGFITTGGGLGGAAIVPLLALLITSFGWRWAAVSIGLIMLAAGIPLAFVIRSRAEDKGMLPDGEVAIESPGAAAEAEAKSVLDLEGEINFTVREALKTRAFWTYIVAMMLRACILSSIVIHQIPHLVDVGIPYQAAANCLGIMIFISIPGRLLFGWMGDKFDKRLLMFISCMIQAVGIWLFINVTSLWMAYVFVAVYGIGYGGAIPMSVALRGQLFGRKIFATIGGISSAFSAIGTVAAPVLAGYVFDVSGSYSVAFYVLLGLISLSGLAFLMIRWPKPPARLTSAPIGS
jgi:MFS family permease